MKQPSDEVPMFSEYKFEVSGDFTENIYNSVGENKWKEVNIVYAENAEIVKTPDPIQFIEDSPILKTIKKNEEIQKQIEETWGNNNESLPN